MGTSNDMGTGIGGACVGDAEKAGWKADSVQSVENRKSYKTKLEKHQFICESFQLQTNQILNAVPYKPRIRPLNPDQKDNLLTQINEWLEQRVIEPSVSPWASPLVPGKK